MKVLDLIWGVLLTITIFALTVVFGYQVLEVDLKQSIFIGATSTLVLRWALAKALQGVEADFNILREGITIVVLTILTYLIYGQN